MRRARPALLPGVVIEDAVGTAVETRLVAVTIN
jgi:hypothetical protein